MSAIVSDRTRDTIRWHGGALLAALTLSYVAVSGYLTMRELIVFVGAAFIGLFVLTRAEAPSWLIAVGFALGTFVAEAAVAGPVADGQGDVSLSPIKVGPIMILAGGVFLMWMRRDRQASVSVGPVGKWLGAYLFWLTACSLVAAHPAAALLRTSQAAIPFLAVIAFIHGRLPRLLPLALAIGACAVHVLLGAFIKGNAFVYTDRVSGLLVMNAYTFAAGAVFVVGLGCWSAGIGRRRLPWAVMMSIGVWGVAVSRGRTGALALIAAVGCLLLLPLDATNERAADRQKKLRVAAVVGIPIALFLTGSVFSRWFVRGDARGIRTLSSRTTVWNTAWKMVLHRPVMGYGPGALRITHSSIDQLLGHTLGTAHNSLIEALVSGGFIGALLWFGFMVALARQALRSDYRRLAVPLFVALTVFSMSIAMMSGFGMGWYVTCGLIALVVPNWNAAAGESDALSVRRVSAAT